jgi:hypothetical protein
MATVLTTSERRKRLRLKRIVISEHNYLALKKVGYTFFLFLTAFRNCLVSTIDSNSRLTGKEKEVTAAETIKQLSNNKGTTVVKVVT